MKTIWPPTYNNFTLRTWAMTLSVLLNAGIMLLIYFRAAVDAMLALSLPGLFAFVLVTRHGIEDAEFSWLGVSAWLTTNLMFDYFVAWLVIRAFQPMRAWWPERQSQG